MLMIPSRALTFGNFGVFCVLRGGRKNAPLCQYMLIVTIKTFIVVPLRQTEFRVQFGNIASMSDCF